ncbi:MAG: hypothetical protein ACI9H9_002734 [Pseudoalteromonas tetraodonis]|jgi:hypothetical protein
MTNKGNFDEEKMTVAIKRRKSERIWDLKKLKSH